MNFLINIVRNALTCVKLPDCVLNKMIFTVITTEFIIHMYLSKCVNFYVFLDIAGVSSVAPTQKTIFVFVMLCLIGKWYWSQWVESQCPAMCQYVSIFVYFWTSLVFQKMH